MKPTDVTWGPYVDTPELFGMWRCYLPDWGGVDTKCNPSNGGRPRTLHRHCHYIKKWGKPRHLDPE